MSKARIADELRTLFATAVRSADPHAVLLEQLPEKPSGRCIVVGAGKASAAMAAALEVAWPDVEMHGVVVTRYGHAVATQKIRIVEASHPVSDAMSEMASMLMLEQVKNLNADDCVIALISGGGSALLALPRQGISLADKQALNRALLQSGATITEMNIVRKQLSDIKGGRLALAADSDGIDGTEDAAGALVTPDTLIRAQQAGLDARALLSAHDSYRFFAALGDLAITGPTLTNVNDIRAIIIT